MARSESWDIAIPLAALLKRKGWSHQLLAEKAGLQRTDVVAMLRTNEKVLKVGRTRAQRIADALGDGVTTLDLGLPPEEAGDVPVSYAHRLAEVEALLERVLAALDREGIVLPDVPPARKSSSTAPRSRRRKATGTDG